MSLRTLRTVTSRACALLVAGLVVVVLGTTVILPALGGGTAYTILTGSMEPAMPPGTVVVVRPTPIDQIRTGDVVTYQLESGKPLTVTHRVASVRTTLDGSVTLVTQGDANNVVDQNPVVAAQVKGVRWYAVPYIGLPALAVDGNIRQVVVMGAAVLLLGYAAYSLAGAAADRRRARRSPATVGSDSVDRLPIGADA